MARLYFRNEKVPFIEGIVTESHQGIDRKRKTISTQTDLENAIQFRSSSFDLNSPYLLLKIDSFNKGKLIIPDCYYRIDIGEKVRLYSIDNFKRLHPDNPFIRINGVQIIGDKKKVKFQATSLENSVFR